MKAEHKYIETYIGVYIVINYEITVHVRFMKGRPMSDTAPFYIQVPKQGRDTIENFVYPKKKSFMIRS